MQVKLIVFDLDGVLVDSCDSHFTSFNQALVLNGYEQFQITYDEHMRLFNGKPTFEKLMILEKRGLPRVSFNNIWKAKQELTLQAIEKYTVDDRVVGILRALKEEGYLLYCASNSIWNTVKVILSKKGFLPYIDYFMSNEDVKHAKPDPEIYYKCFQRARVSPNECIIIEDSEIGQTAARLSGAHVVEISNCNELSYEVIKSSMSSTVSVNVNKPKLNIVIPMAGLGSRFSQAGYTFPKPLIEVNGKPMIQVVVDNLKFMTADTRFIFIVQQEHVQKYNIKQFLKAIAPDCAVIQIDGLTEGAACTVLKARDHINNDEHLVIANSDQYLEWDADEFLGTAVSREVDCLISTFKSLHPKWSYAKLDENGKVTTVAEKNPISENATTGIYYWRRGQEFVKYAEQMIEKNIRVNNEFYVCPVFNEAILDRKHIEIKDCKKMWGLGTPEDLNVYLTKSNI